MQSIRKPSEEMPWLKYYDSLFDENELPKKSIYQLAKDANKYNMNKVAIDLRTSSNDYSKGIKITYKEFFDKINKNAKASSIIGVSKDEIVPIILPNVPEARTLIYSNSIIGSVSYPISPLLPVNQLDQLISDNNIKNIFIFEAFYEKFENALKNENLENIVCLDGTESLPNNIRTLKKLKDGLINKKGNLLLPKNKKIMLWDEYQKYSKQIKGNMEPLYEDNHVTAIIGTSGTTGLPKGVCLTDENINVAALAYKNGKVFEGDTFLDALLPSIGYGISMLHFQTIAGKHVYLLPELLTTNTAKALSVLKPDNFPGGPVHYINLKASEEFKNGKVPKHNNYISGGASLPKDVESTLNGVDEGYTEEGINDSIIVRQGYGLSENVARGTYSKRGSYKFGSIGIPMPYQTIGIFKPGTDEELDYNEQGEICITGPTVMQGYLKNEEETNKVILLHSDGKRWIHTKDIGYMDEDGHIFHVDRIKNIFMRTGFNVHPAKIAEYINTIPYVRNSVVIGFEHPKEQSVPVAFVELEPSALINHTKEELLNEINKLCYSNLEETSVPYDYVVVDSLPINLGGKIDIQTIKKESEIDLNHNSKVLKKELKFNKN